MAGVKTLFVEETEGNRELLIRDRTREIALKLSKSEEETLIFKLLLGERGEEEKTEVEVDMGDSEVDRFGTETLFGLVDIADAEVPEEGSTFIALASLPGATTGLSGPRPKAPLLLDPSHATLSIKLTQQK